ncbi:MAG: M24 family metallopeptidase [Acidobacteria bacterium]|nr:M24 family metallopeptidase [Acidobacteriota bacterium]
MLKLTEIQEQLRVQGVDGWLFYDHHRRDPIAYRVLGIEANDHVSRRWYYWIPLEGEPVRLAHRIEPYRLDALPGDKRLYSGWREQRTALEGMLAGARRIAMQYSPDCMIPHVSLVDGGTIDLIRGFGKEVVSSAELVQFFEARWDADQLEMHHEAGRRIDGVLDEAFALIRERTRSGGSVHEVEVADLIRARFAKAEIFSDSGPIVGCGPHSGDPHYEPSAEKGVEIRSGDFVLIDLWGKLARPRSVYYDITWTGFCGDTPPEAVQKVFEIVTGARDAALAAVDAAVREGRAVAGRDIDDVARGFITDAGFGEYFVHRTGHSIGEDIHGAGANLDNLETQDDRPLIPRTCFSIEPGIYLPEFGVRSEIDCYVSQTGAVATGRVQREIVRL